MGERYESLNAGLLTYGKKHTRLSVTKKVLGYEFIPEGELYFNELNAREQDYDLAKAKGKELELKLKTFYPPSLHKKNKPNYLLVIDGTEYEAFKVDCDQDKRYLFWYLSRMGNLA
ncbi:hypothetical protein [Enterococcus sp. DIV1420a]|uniref:hypothetical protein n=1 Tax=Enterococcus TaxID=1350 RepID=UPI003F24135A